ncbi:MAG: N-6 DNA methylase [Prevotellaceae bacterium]|jgi:hypothetical protein|nr:N-6 DNA methylase [Prevotellaceae bacterium]
MKQLSDILFELELKNEDGSCKDGLYFANDKKWKSNLHFSNRVSRRLELLNPDAFFCFDNKPLILFFENPQNKSDLHRIIWNFNEIPVVIIVETGGVEIYNGFHLLESGKNKGLLEKLGNQKLDDFSYFNLVTGKTWETYQKELSFKNRVDHKLLDNIGAAREQIIKQFPPVGENGEETKKRYIKITNALLGKIIFVRYLIDRKVKIYFDGESKERTNLEFCEILQQPTRAKQFFNTLADKKVGFNGDLFRLEDSEYQEIPKEAYFILIRLLNSQEISTGQQSLFDLYDFSVIPVEFISNVYEYFIGGKNQAKQGAYYTPLFLVDYILSETVEKFIIDNHTCNCKVLDPACGSGIFLVETLRKLIEKYRENAPENKEQFKEGVKSIAQNNIYGIDKDESAVQVAIFSIYLTLLDYMNPPEITGFTFPCLKGTNFFCEDFFDETKEFNAIFKQNDFKFNFIIGNPPWFRGKNEKQKTKKEPLYVEYIEKRKKGQPEPVIDIGNKEIAQAFLLRSSDFSTANTKCALIVTSKVLYNLQSKDFRQYFLHNYLIERVFELAPVRREVFDKSNDKAIAPACILFFGYANGKNTDFNLIEHITLKPSRFFSMFKIFSIYRHDIQTVQQDRLKKYDWLWKVLVYGSYLDFNFIKRLKEDYQTIQDSFDENTLIKQGIKRVDGNKKINTSNLVGWDFLDLNKKEIQQFHINNQHDKWDLSEVGYIYRENGKICEDVFSPPMLLIKETVNTCLESVSAVSQSKILFTDKITSIKFRKNKSSDDYYLLASLMNSTLFAYYILHISSTAGIMIEQQINDIERFSFPYLQINDIVQNAKQIEELKIKEESNGINNQSEIDKTLILINNLITKSFSLNNEEQTLIDYGKNVIIPLLMRHKGHEKLFLPCKINDKILNDYANLFTERFTSNFEKIGKRFIVEIWHTNRIVGMFFKVIPQSEYTQQIVWINKQTDTAGIFNKIIKLGATKITDRLFVQKDVRGFEKEYFYIFKPNEKRLWHKAVGYLDVEEFADAILKAGRGNNE